jgi:hypothetical protein
MRTIARPAIVLCLLGVAALAHDISGKWTFQVETDAGSGSPTFVFQQAGEKLTGTYSGQLGTAQLTGTVKGDDIQFSFSAPALENGKVAYTGKIDASGKMKGEVDLAGLGKGTWTGTKQ